MFIEKVTLNVFCRVRALTQWQTAVSSLPLILSQINLVQIVGSSLLLSLCSMQILVNSFLAI